MAELAASWLSRRFTDGDFRSTLKKLLLRDFVERGKKRPGNKTEFIETPVGALVTSLDVRNFIMALNKEVQTRNKFFRKNKDYIPLTPVNLSSVFQGNIIASTPYTNIQEALEEFVGDGIINFSSVIPSDFKALKGNARTLFLAYEDKFVRLEFNATKVENVEGGVKITYNQEQSWYDQGRSSVNINYNDLDYILNNLANLSDKVKIGIANFNTMKVKWTNNIYVAESTLNSTISRNTKHPNITINKRVLNGHVILKINQEVEELLYEKLKGTVITAARFNKFKQLLNKAEMACLCDCNYCTCDCNYCTCDCNYCTCNCNYCTCDCNYCTCNCNYCTCNNNKEYTDKVTYNYDVLCTCNANWVCSVNWGGYRIGNYVNKYLTECTCNGDRSIPQYNMYGQLVSRTCSCNSNVYNKVVQKAVKTEVCSCNVDKQWTFNITGKPVWEKGTTGQIDNNKPTGGQFGPSSVTKRVCVCHTNITVTEKCATNRTMSYLDGSSTMQCVCNINKNRAISCSANSEYKYVTDYDQFRKVK